jgi:hypothetical protein
MSTLKPLPLIALFFGFSWFPWSTSEDEENTTQNEESSNGNGLNFELSKVIEPPAPELFHQKLPLNIELDVQGLGMVYSSSCAGCHSSTFEEWQHSAHSNGYQNPVYLDKIKEYGSGTLCTQCHLPLAQQHNELTTSYIEDDYSRPVNEANAGWNLSLQLDSVGCASCHVREGVIVGTKTAEQPHPVRNSATMQISKSCEKCHQYTFPGEQEPAYNTYLEWKNSAYGNAGIECQTCHMQKSTVIGEGYLNHDMSLPISQGITVLVNLPSLIIQRNQATELSVTLYNTGIGHAWPSSSPFVEKFLIIRIINDEGDKLMDDISHHIGIHSDPNIGSSNILPEENHSFIQNIMIPTKFSSQYANLIVGYQQGNDFEAIKTFTVEIR